MSGWIDLEEIRCFHLRRRVLGATRDALRQWGSRRQEARVLWGGRLQSPTEMMVTHVIVPQQVNSFLETVVDGMELVRISELLYQEKAVLVAQVHTHPGSAWHSDEDNHFPITAQQGSLSIVVPNFAREPLRDLAECAVYRLTAKGWEEVRGTDVVTLLPVERVA